LIAGSRVAWNHAATVSLIAFRLSHRQSFCITFSAGANML